MAVVLHGRNGSVVFDSGYDEHIFNWTLTPVRDLPDSTTFGHTWRQFVEGLKGATGSFEQRVDPDIAFVILPAKGAVILRFANGYAITGDIWITDQPITVPHDDLEGIVQNFTFDGEPSIDAPDSHSPSQSPSPST